MRTLEVYPSDLERTYHLVMNPAIHVDGDTAKSKSNWGSSPATRTTAPVFEMLGRYSDELRRTPEGWRFRAALPTATSPTSRSRASSDPAYAPPPSNVVAASTLTVSTATKFMGSGLGGRLAGEGPEDEGGPDGCARAGIRATERIGGGIAGSEETGDRATAVRCDHAAVDIGLQTALRAEAAGQQPGRRSTAGRPTGGAGARRS